jgi:hypothetical protein
VHVVEGEGEGVGAAAGDAAPAASAAPASPPPHAPHGGSSPYASHFHHDLAFKAGVAPKADIPHFQHRHTQREDALALALATHDTHIADAVGAHHAPSASLKAVLDRLVGKH